MSIDVRGGAFRARVRRRRVTVSATFPSREEAEAWRSAALLAISKGEAPTAPPRRVVEVPRALTVEDACREYVQGMMSGAVRTRRGHRYKPSTIRGVENRLRLYAVRDLGRLPLAGLRRGDVKRLVDDVAVETSPATAGNVRACLRVVLARQVELEVISENVATGVRVPTADNAPARFLEPSEADRIQALADAHERGEVVVDGKRCRSSPVIGAFVATALGTGLRLGELQALVWGRGGIDLERRVVVVKATRDRTGEIVDTKSRRPREVPLGADLVARLRLYRMTAPRSADGARVFWRSHRRAWEQVRTAAGIPELRVHDLRHTCATFWLAAGLSVHAVGKLLGHADAGLTLRLYGHALPQETSSAADRLEAWREAQRA